MSRIRILSSYYPHLLHTKCHTIVAYKILGSSNTYICQNCYIRNPRPSECRFGVFHGFMYNSYATIVCSRCHRDAGNLEPITQCNPCLRAYQNFINGCRMSNINPYDIESFTVNTETKRIVNVTINGHDYVPTPDSAP